jgi:hypothetical protein
MRHFATFGLFHMLALFSEVISGDNIGLPDEGSGKL